VKKLQNKIDRLRRFLIHIYGEERGNERFGSLMRSNDLKTSMFKYGQENGTLRYNEWREKQKGKGSLEYYISKYGEVEGKLKYEEKNSKLSVSYGSLKKNGYSDDEIENIRKKHSEKSKHTLSNFIKRYGEKEGAVKYDDYLKRKFNPRSVEKVMNQYNISMEEATKKVSNIQRRDLNFYIKKYGEVEGKERFENANKKRAYANTRDYYVKKYGEIEGNVKYDQVMYNRTNHNRLEYYTSKYGEYEGSVLYNRRIAKMISKFPTFSSKIESEFNQLVFNELSDDLKNNFIGHPITEKPCFLFSEKYNRYFVPDIKIRNVIIEFDGSYWHSLPNVIENDVKKNDAYHTLGFKLLRINEVDFLKDKNYCLQLTLNFIMSNIEEK